MLSRDGKSHDNSSKKTWAGAMIIFFDNLKLLVKRHD